MQTQGNQREAILFSYLAGIIDGEGTIRIGKISPRLKCSRKRRSFWYSPYIQVGITNQEITDLLYNTFGGSVRKECVLYYKPIYRWTISSRKRISEVAKILLPYLIIKKQQAQIIIEYCDNVVDLKHKFHHKIPTKTYYTELQRREEAYKKMRKLNAVAAPATTKREDIREDEAIV